MLSLLLERPTSIVILTQTGLRKKGKGASPRPPSGVACFSEEVLPNIVWRNLLEDNGKV